MTSSPPSNSEAGSASFARLDPRIQRWIWQQEWRELRDAQERAIPLLIEPRSDVIIAASTASGKTEAAFFPILTRLASSGGLAVYISPLKALINDQWGRLSALCQALEIRVTPWHGDIGASRKQAFRRKPEGCLLITPESLEGFLVRDGFGLATLFSKLEYLVVDELHAFLENVRGKQLQSLLHRIERGIGRSFVRVGLSATLGDMRLAANFLRPNAGEDVQIVEGRSNGQELKVMVKGVRDAPANLDAAAEGLHGLFAVAADVFRLRGHNNLIFPNSRRNVEIIADLLREKSERENVPNEFWPHHGSLSKSLREEVEQALKSGERPTSAVATTTLELGIDIGGVKSVVQVGAAPSVASLRQRLGRSGRRPGEAAILRCFCIESDLDVDSPLSDQLRESLLETCAQIRLLVRGWYEPAQTQPLHLSTLVQQLLSLVAERGGVDASKAWGTLCDMGPFSHITKTDFADLLRELARREVLLQDSSGVLLHAPLGERLVNHYSFLAAFVGDEEFRIVTDGRTLGSLPLSRPVAPGSFLIFAGRRWRVRSCSATDKVIDVEPARSGQVPKFDGGGGQAHDEVRREMRRILEEDSPVAFLDAQANTFLSEARDNYARLRLADSPIVDEGGDIRILTWRGDRVNDTLSLWLKRLGLESSNEGLSIVVFDASRARVLDALMDIGDSDPWQPEEIAAGVENLIEEKWDGLLPRPLLLRGYGARHFDIEPSQQLAREIVASSA